MPHVLALTTNGATAWSILIAAIGGAAASIIGAIYTFKNHANAKLPSNSISTGAAIENTSVNIGTLVHMIADEFGKRASVPTPRETAANAPGSTLNDPPPPPTPVPPPVPPTVTG